MKKVSTPAPDTVIDAGRANPIAFAERLPKLRVKEQTENIIYSVAPRPEFIAYIRRYLKWIGRGPPDSAQIVLSAGGSTQLIAAFYWAVQELRGRKPTTIQSTTVPPFYRLHQQIAETIINCTWVPTTATGPGAAHKADIQVMVSPNNPNGTLQVPNPKLSDKQYLLLDSAYDTPQFTGSRKSVNPWVAPLLSEGKQNFAWVNSLSKLGLAGIRLGFAVTANTQLADTMVEYIQRVSLGTNTWAVANMMTNLNWFAGGCAKLPFVGDDNKEPPRLERFDNMLFQLMRKRHRQIRRIVPKRLIRSNERVTLLFLEEPASVFEAQNIIVRPGSVFGVSDAFSRIQLMISDSDWEMLLQRLRNIYGKRKCKCNRIRGQKASKQATKKATKG